MLIIELSILSLLLALACAAVPWLAWRLPSGLLVGGFLLGILASLLGVLLAPPLYPWSNLVVLLLALTAGLLLGRGMPPRFWPFLITLVVLSVLDGAQTVLTGGLTPLPGSPPAHQASVASGVPLYLNVSLLLPIGHYMLGIFDLLVITTAAEHWRRRGESYLIAVVPGVLGFLLVYGVVWLTQRGGWPLIPFITAGWLGSNVASQFRSRNARQAVPKGQ